MLRRLVLSGLAFAVAAVAAGSALAAVNPTLWGSTSSATLALHVTGQLPTLTAALPGSEKTGTLTVRNDGSDSGSLEFTLTAQGSAAARAEFLLTVRGPGGIVFHGPLAARIAVPLGTIGRGQSGTYRLTLQLSPQTTVQGAGTRFTARFIVSQ